MATAPIYTLYREEVEERSKYSFPHSYPFNYSSPISFAIPHLRLACSASHLNFSELGDQHYSADLPLRLPARIRLPSPSLVRVLEALWQMANSLAMDNGNFNWISLSYCRLYLLTNLYTVGVSANLLKTAWLCHFLKHVELQRSQKNLELLEGLVSHSRPLGDCFTYCNTYRIVLHAFLGKC